MKDGPVWMTYEENARRQLERLLDTRAPGQGYIDNLSAGQVYRKNQQPNKLFGPFDCGVNAKNAKENLMIECTLQEAIWRCKESGGAFWRKSRGPITRFTDKYLENPNSAFKVEEVLEPWIYEPPKQSAFQKWNAPLNRPVKYFPEKSESCWVNKELLESERKQGWNAAIDYFLSHAVLDGAVHKSIVESLKELKEL